MWPRPDVAWDVLEKLGRVGAEILAIQAKTIDGLRVKARAACWALLGDLAPGSNTTLDKSMALSIVRDLIRLHDPSHGTPRSVEKTGGGRHEWRDQIHCAPAG